LDSIRDSIPLEMILKTYMDETIEDHTEIKIKEEIVSQEPVHAQDAQQSAQSAQSAEQSQSNDAAVIAAGIEPSSDAFPSLNASNASNASTASNASIKFNDMDSAIDTNNNEHAIHAPKTEDRLEQISNERYMQRKMQEEEDDEEGGLERIKIGEDVQLDVFDVHSMEEPSRRLNFDAPDLDDIEILS
jgi:hypothetical protein